MPGIPERIPAHLRFRAAAYLVLMIALIPTFVVYWRVEKDVRAQDAIRFGNAAAGVRKVVDESLERLAGDLRALSGFFAAKESVSPAEWERFLAVLDSGQRHRGVRSMGFAEKVTGEQRARFLGMMRTRLGPDFDIFPPSSFPLAFPTVYFRQLSTNVESLRPGWDFYSEPGHRLALSSVLATGEPAASEKLTFWDEGARASEGFTLFVPVHSTDGDLRGVIFGSFVPQQLFEAVAHRHFDDGVSMELFDGAFAEPGSLLASFGLPPAPAPTLFSEVIPIRVMNRSFLLRIATAPAFSEASPQLLPNLALAAGLFLSLLLFRITWRQIDARCGAERLNQRLRNSEEQLRAANEKLQSRIADAKSTEALLAYERDLLRMLLDHSPDRIYFKDRESRFIKCGRAVMQRLGLPLAGDCAGKTDRDFFTEQHARPAFDLEQEIIRTGQPVIGLVEKETWQDGHESWVLTSKMPLRDKHGNIIGTFGISKDISELKKAELELQKEKELLAVTLRSIGDGVVTTDVDGRIVLFNQVAEKVTGWSHADAVGKPLAEVFCTGVDEPRSGACDTSSEDNHDAILTTRDGHKKTISRSFAPMVGQDGKRIGAVLVFRDITDKLKTDAELLKASKLESIGVLAGGIAHDFNNILTVILGNISLARMAKATGRPMVDVLAQAEKASLRARELTQRLLTFAKGGAPIKKTLDLAPIVRDCAARALQGAEVTPEFFIAGDLWPVVADESQIAQVVQNLISYARSSMSKDPRLDIHVLNQDIGRDPLLLVTPGRYVRISIRDYGADIQPEHLTKIFDPYFGAKRQGHGLELATAYSIVRKHDGQIRVESISGQGMVFHIYLPAAATEVGPMATSLRGAHDRVVPNEPRTARRILVMDDEGPIRTLAVHLLDSIGHTTEKAADGAEAIEVYERARKKGEPFDAVIMDLTIPNGMGGKETIRQLKQLDPRVRAIVSSGYSNDPVMAQFREHGFSGVMPKPYGTQELAAALDELFRGNPELQD